MADVLVNDCKKEKCDCNYIDKESGMGPCSLMDIIAHPCILDLSHGDSNSICGKLQIPVWNVSYVGSLFNKYLSFLKKTGRKFESILVIKILSHLFPALYKKFKLKMSTWNPLSRTEQRTSVNVSLWLIKFESILQNCMTPWINSLNTESVALRPWSVLI